MPQSSPEAKAGTMGLRAINTTKVIANSFFIVKYVLVICDLNCYFFLKKKENFDFFHIYCFVIRTNMKHSIELEMVFVRLPMVESSLEEDTGSSNSISGTSPLTSSASTYRNS